MADLQTSTIVRNSICGLCSRAVLQTSTIAHPTLLPFNSTNCLCDRVFINHRGPDTKDGFASHLYHGLLRHGLQPFLDREVLQKGDYLAPQIKGAIKDASVHITIFSPTYAQSSWCLDELVLILNKSGDTVIPVFYHVKPSELRLTEKDGRYAGALNILEEKGTYDRQILENWRNALSDVSNIVGFELQAYNGDEGKLVDSVVQCVFKKLVQEHLNAALQPALYVARHPTGLQEKVEDFEKTVLLQKQKSCEVQVLGIVGLGGAGKTTLAKIFFNTKRNNFVNSCFIFDCKETARLSSINSLQSKLLKKLTQSTEQIESIEEGIEILRRYLSSSKALIVLDDVDHPHQLEAILPIKEVLDSRSLILVTSRSKDVLTSSGIAELSIYKLTGLDEQHSRELLCSYAFLQPRPQPGFEDLVDEFCKACCGLPLSLKVHGALLSQKYDRSNWEGQLDKLRQLILPTEIHRTLQISYDALDRDEQQIFLDIACFFIGEDRDMAIRIWEGSGLKGKVGLLNLVSKCLVDVDTEDNTIKMDDHLRDLGRNIAGQENSLVRLWQTRDNIHDLWQQSRNDQVITRVRGIMTVRGLVDFHDDIPKEPESEQEESPWYKSWYDEPVKLGSSLRKLIDPTPYRFRDLQLVATENDLLKSILRRTQSPNLIWLRWNNCPYSFLPPWIPMKNTRVLEVAGTKLKKLWQTESQTPLELRELIIHAPLSEFPKSIGQLKHLKKIVVDFPTMFTHLKTLPEEFCNLRSLKYLRLRYENMESLPDSFGNLTNLQHLDLCDCYRLGGLPNSFGNLGRLKHLNMRFCRDLTMSDETFGKISTLEYLNLLGCTSVEVLPAQIAHQPSLKSLKLWSTGLKELPEDIGKLSDLETLSLGSSRLEMLPHSLGQLSRLKVLGVVGCRNLRSMPDWWRLSTRRSNLSPDSYGIQSSPREAVNMEMPLTGWMYGLERLYLHRVGISQISFVEGVCPNLQYLSIYQCDNLVVVRTLPPKLITLTLIYQNQLRKIQGLCNLTNLRNLSISGCVKLRELSVKGLISLEKFSATGCSELKIVHGLGQLAELRILEMSSCSALEELAGVQDLRLLELLDVVECPRLRWGEGAVEQLGQRIKKLYL